MLYDWDHIVRNFVGVLFGSQDRASPVGAMMVRYTPGSSPSPSLDRRTLLRVMLAGAGVAATGGLAHDAVTPGTAGPRTQLGEDPHRVVIAGVPPAVLPGDIGGHGDEATGHSSGRRRYPKLTGVGATMAPGSQE